MLYTGLCHFGNVNIFFVIKRMIGHNIVLDDDDDDDDDDDEGLVTCSRAPLTSLNVQGVNVPAVLVPFMGPEGPGVVS